MLLRVELYLHSESNQESIVEEFTNLICFVLSSCPSLKQLSLVFEGEIHVDFANKCELLEMMVNAFIGQILPDVYAKFPSKKDVCFLIHYDIYVENNYVVCLILLLFYLFFTTLNSHRHRVKYILKCWKNSYRVLF